jgi:branched-chain amino acid transport system substrate-binding protein
LRGRSLAAAACLLGALGAAGITACGGSSDDKGSGSSGGGTINIYSSLPLQGASSPQTKAMVNGMRLALDKANNKAGTFTVKFTSLDDSTAAQGAWEPGQTAKNARQAAQDTKAVYYIGEFNSGASAISIPILNQAGLAQVSPANTGIGLTIKEPGSSPGEPDKYYPTGKRTYMRIVPRDSIQAPDLLTAMKQDGCTLVGVANDKEVYGSGVGRLLLLKAPALGVKISSNTGIDKSAPNYRAFAAKLKGEGIDCFAFGGVTANGAIQLYKDVAAAIPNAKLYGPDGVCESGFTNPAKKGVPKDVGARFKCTVAAQDLSAYPGGRAFLVDYKAKFADARPDPYAIYGFEAMKLGLDTIAKLGDKGGDKAEVLKALQATKDRPSVLGTYSFDKNGDTTLTAYGLFKVGPDGNPTFIKTIESGS